MSEDDDDPVVDEIPVYLTQELSEKLFIYQYPVQPSALSNQHFNVIKSQIKPELQEVILDIGLDTSSSNYDKSHGEQIANTVDKDKNSQNKMFSSNMMDRIRLESTRGMIDKDSYAIGIMKNKQLIISPIRGVISLFPNFSHITHEEEKETEGGGGGANEDEEIEEPAKVVRVQFARMETEKSKKAREASYNYFCQKSAEEPWYHTEYFDVDSAMSKLERAKININNFGTDTPMDLTSSGYVDCLLPKGVDVDNTTPSSYDSPTSVNRLRQLPLPEQVKHVLFDVKVVNAQQLSWMLRTETERIVQCLQTCAVMVLGNWVLRSDLLYSSTHNGIPSQAMIRARDYILHEFHKGNTVERKSLCAIVGLPQEELREMMSQVGVLRRNKGWHFKLPPDTSFVERFPEIVEQQNLLWEARAKGLLENMEAITPVTPTKALRKRKESETLASVAGLTSRQRKSMSSDSECETTAASGTNKKSGGKNPRRQNKNLENLNTTAKRTTTAGGGDIEVKQEILENS